LCNKRGHSLINSGITGPTGGEQLVTGWHFHDVALRGDPLRLQTTNQWSTLNRPRLPLQPSRPGQPGLVAQQDGVTVTVFAIDVAGGRIRHIWVVRNPEKLHPWTSG
jgi:hypothetical protein